MGPDVPCYSVHRLRVRLRQAPGWTLLLPLVLLVLLLLLLLHLVPGGGRVARRGGSAGAATHALLPSQALARQKWPRLFGQSGSYGIQANGTAELAGTASDGHHQLIMGFSGDNTTLNRQLTTYNQTYVDTSLWGAIYKDCKAFYGPRVADTKKCSPDTNPALRRKILSAVDAHLNDPSLQMDRHVVGFWILDDYMGPLRHTLEVIKQHIVAAKAPFPRPTLCGFGGRLDARTSLTAPFTPHHALFDLAISNYTPRGCDIAVYYPYAWNVVDDPNPDLNDWSMRNLLPYMLQKTQDVGLARDPSWHPQTLVWGAIPQVFGKRHWVRGSYVVPTTTDIVTQMTAYCRAGAIAVWGYAWNSAQRGYAEPYNTASLRQGLKAGAAQCRRVWYAPTTHHDRTTVRRSRRGGGVTAATSPPAGKGQG